MSNPICVLLPLDGIGHPPVMGLYWPATGEVLMQGLPSAAPPLALTCGLRRWPVDDAGRSRADPHIADDELLALTAAGDGPQVLYAVLEAVPLAEAAPLRAAG